VAPPEDWLPYGRQSFFCEDIVAGFALFIHSGTRQGLHHALSLAMTALSFGETTTIALFNEGLAGWVEAYTHADADFGSGRFAHRMEEGFRRMNVPSLPTMLGDCREIGGPKLQVLACSGSVEVFGYESSELIATGMVDDVVGLPSIWRCTAQSRIVSV
jgi:peroxiredoxin family protein